MAKKTDKIIEPIDANFDDVAELVIKPAPPKFIRNSVLSTKVSSVPAPPQQQILDLGIEIEKDVNGIVMGVLENGIPYLTQSGLAEITGAPRSVIYDITQDWEKQLPDRSKK